MTTLAFDGEIVATDSMACTGSLICSTEAQKLYTFTLLYEEEGTHTVFSEKRGEDPIEVTGTFQREKSGVACIAGTYNHGLAMFDWFLEGADPDLFNDLWEACLHVYLESDNEWLFYEGSSRHLPWKGKWSQGSGLESALAAMHSGKDAKGAIEVASMVDVYTGGAVQWYNVKTGENNIEELFGQEGSEDELTETGEEAS